MEPRPSDPTSEPDPFEAPAPVDPPLTAEPSVEPDVRRYEITGKANLLKRFLAVFIDGIIGGILSLFPWIGALLGGAYILVRDGLEYDFMNRRSIGKKIMNLRPVSLKGEVMDVNLSVRRNWPLALGYLGSFMADVTGNPVGLWNLLGLVGLVEAVLVLTDHLGRRFGDKFADTIVIETTD